MRTLRISALRPVHHIYLLQKTKQKSKRIVCPRRLFISTAVDLDQLDLHVVDFQESRDSNNAKLTLLLPVLYALASSISSGFYP